MELVMGSLWQDESGATTTEYALVLALVVIVLIGTLNTLGTTLQGKLLDIVDQIGGAN
ncbi:MAG: Flp family type IVb pilin [Symbiobacteriia bacterium]